MINYILEQVSLKLNSVQERSLKYSKLFTQRDNCLLNTNLSVVPFPFLGAVFDPLPINLLEPVARYPEQPYVIVVVNGNRERWIHVGVIVRFAARDAFAYADVLEPGGEGIVRSEEENDTLWRNKHDSTETDAHTLTDFETRGFFAH